MTRAERRELDRSVRDARALANHPSAAARAHARRALELAELAEDDDPRPALLLRLRLRLQGVDAG